MLNGLSERTFFSFCSSHARAGGSRKALAPCTVCATRTALGLTGLWASRESSFCVSQASTSLASEESHTVPRSDRNKFIFDLFSSSFLIRKTGAFLLSEPCLTLLSSILSLSREKNWILFLCSFSSVGRILSWVLVGVASLLFVYQWTQFMWWVVGISGAG